MEVNEVSERMISNCKFGPVYVPSLIQNSCNRFTHFQFYFVYSLPLILRDEESTMSYVYQRKEVKRVNPVNVRTKCTPQKYYEQKPALFNLLSYYYRYLLLSLLFFLCFYYGLKHKDPTVGANHHDREPRLVIKSWIHNLDSSVPTLRLGFITQFFLAATNDFLFQNPVPTLRLFATWR